MKKETEVIRHYWALLYGFVFVKVEIIISPYPLLITVFTLVSNLVPAKMNLSDWMKLMFKTSTK